MIPARASLLTPRDTPRNQGTGNRLCCFFGTRKALEVMQDRSPRAGERYSISYLRKIGQMAQGVSGDYGVAPYAMARALELYGACPQSVFDDGGNAWVDAPQAAFDRAIKPVRMVTMPYIEGDTTGLTSIRYWIARGYPLIAHINVHSGYSSVSGPVESHTWDCSGPVLDEHITCLTGYDEKCVIASDSGYGSYGDDLGRVGFTNDKFVHGPQRCVNTLWLISDGPVRPVPVEGYMPIPAKLTLAEMGPAVMLKRAELKAAEDAATNAKRVEWTERILRRQPANAVGWQWAVDALVAEDMTDRQADICISGMPGDFLKLADSLGLDSSKLAKDLT